MKILSTNLFSAIYLPPTNNQKNTGISFCAKKAPETDFFELSYQSKARQVYSKLNKLTKEEYMSLTEVEKDFLRSENRLRIEEGMMPLDRDVRIHNFAANAIKETFDKQYGKNNYVVITIGRSLSSISKTLGLKIGEDNVKNIPLSAANEFFITGESLNDYEKSIKSITELYGFNTFKKYLSSIGLDKETIENSGKQYVIMDFTASGRSLAGAYTILTSNELLGNSKRNITTASMSDITALTGHAIHQVLDQMLNACEFKKYSYVDNLHTKIENIGSASDYTQFGKKKEIRLKKLFGFMLLDEQYSDKKPLIEDKITIHFPTIKFPKQNAKLWNTIEKQYSIDTQEDIQEIFKIMHAIREPLNEIRYANKKLTQHRTELFTKTKNQCEELFMKSFPLEYQYYKNIQLFEQNKDTLPSRLVEETEPLIDTGIIRKNSTLYKIFEETDNKLLTLQNKKFFIDDEFSELVFDNELLTDFAKEIRRHYLSDKSKSKYYETFRPELFEFLDKVAPKYSIEKGQELTKSVKRLAIKKQCEVDDMYENFISETLELIKSTKKYPNQSELSRIVEQQNEILDEIICDK